MRDNDLTNVLCHVYDIKKVVDEKLLLEDSDEYTVGNCLSDVIEILEDRKSTRLNSSHLVISYAVFCLKKNIIDKVSVRDAHYFRLVYLYIHAGNYAI